MARHPAHHRPEDRYGLFSRRRHFCQISAAGIAIALPMYFDAAETLALQQDMNQKPALHYDVTHRRGERRVWVQLR